MLKVASPARRRPSGYAGHASPFQCVAAPRVARRAKAGGARRDRTADLVIANDALSQLSYGPIAADANLNDGGQQSAPFTIRAKAKSRTRNSRFPRQLPGTSLVCQGGNRYLAGGRIRDRTRELIPMR